ncbi:MAG TPA: nicotinamide-nucleotide amidohydrolase family protein [bacterium (Candidatus Stahlbacteria)]|nr:nicotinamide-nucleotide amidohydrolase family protein [Candidatus Stahlbacteria bacterium]
MKINNKNNENLAVQLGKLLKEKHLTISVAESCTGGLVMDKITDVSGSSEYFMGGVVAYSNELKMKILGVKKETLERVGAVSREVAHEMASGIKNFTGTDIGVSTTGIAGPTGATPTKPVGLIYIGFCSADKEVVEKHIFKGDRQMVKEQAAQAALDIVRRWLEKL